MIKLGIYQYYKGNLYQVIGLSRHVETLEEMVVYQELYGSYGLWLRPINSFFEELIVDNVPTPRFKFIEPSLSRPPKLRD